MELLYDVNLHTLTDEHLVGPWRVTSRVLSQSDPDHPLARATHFQLAADNQLALTVTEPPEDHAGIWTVRRDELLNRPYVELTLPDGPTRALITRLRRIPNGPTRQLTLYFQSGMELLLDTD